MRHNQEDWTLMQDDRRHRATEEYIAKRDAVPVCSPASASETEVARGAAGVVVVDNAARCFCCNELANYCQNGNDPI